MIRHPVGTLVLLMIASAGCAARAAAPHAHVTEAQSYQLLVPPDVPDTRYPGGVRVLTDRPYAYWHNVAVFPSLEECESTRIHHIDDSIDHARAEVGDQAKFQLPVRRAVHARCVPSGTERDEPPATDPARPST
jgi:hypothetical protein